MRLRRACSGRSTHGARPDARARCRAAKRSIVMPPPWRRRACALRAVVTVDLNRFVCDVRRCYPVIGGALVYKDTTHLLEPFMRSLAPYFQRELAPLVS